MSRNRDIITTVDVVILTLTQDGLCVLLTERENAPFQCVRALPGGFIRPDEDKTAEDAALRVLAQKIGVHDVHLEQLMSFSGPDRDPRGYSVSVAHIALVPPSVIPEDGLLVPVRNVHGLAFDHDEILAVAVERLRRKSAYSSAPAALIESPFTLPELYGAYSAILGMTPDPSSFRRKVLAVGAITPTGTSRPGGGQGKGRGGKTYVLPNEEVRTFDITFKPSVL